MDQAQQDQHPAMSGDDELAKALQGGLQFEETPVPGEPNDKPKGDDVGGDSAASTNAPDPLAVGNDKPQQDAPTEDPAIVLPTPPAEDSKPADTDEPVIQHTHEKKSVSTGNSNLDKIKTSALEELRPLVGKLNLPADEKFDTLLLIIRSTGDHSFNGAPDPAYDDGHIPFGAIDWLQNKMQPGDSLFDALSDEIDASTRLVSYTYNDKFGFTRTGYMKIGLFNQGAPSPTIEVIFPGWRSDFESEGTKRGWLAWAAVRPDQRYAVIKIMDRLPGARLAQMAITGSHQPAGELVAQALQASGILSNADATDATGISQGDRLLAGTIAAGLEVQSATHVDGPFGLGIKELLIRQELGRPDQPSETEHARRYAEATTDVWSLDPYNTVNGPDRHWLREGVSVLTRQLGLFAREAAQVIALARGGYEADMAAALPHVTGELTRVTLERSELTDHHTDRRLIGRLAARHARPPVIRHRVGHGLTHALASGGPGGQAYMYNAHRPGVTFGPSV